MKGRGLFQSAAFMIFSQLLIKIKIGGREGGIEIKHWIQDISKEMWNNRAINWIF